MEFFQLSLAVSICMNNNERKMGVATNVLRNLGLKVSESEISLRTIPIRKLCSRKQT